MVAALLLPGWSTGVHGGVTLTATEKTNAPGSHKATMAVLDADNRAAVTAFPLSVRSGERFLRDSDGAPFLIHGDTAWSLIAELTPQDVDLYLDDRRARGFNSLLVNLIEHRFATHAPANANGQGPFLKEGDFATPNDEYFAYADWVLRRAADKGFLVLLTPSYAGSGGGGEGWYQEMQASGPAKLRSYGRYLGRRYRDFGNIVWVHGGDYDPTDNSLITAIAEGIRDTDPHSLHTAHCAPERAASACFGDEPWLSLNSVYAYESAYSAALAEYRRPKVQPFFLIEGSYENEHGSTEQSLRSQAYEVLLSGAAGEVFGNNPLWHFGSGGLYAAVVTWRQALGSPGARSMTQLSKLFAGLPWWKLEPDIDNTLLTEGIGRGSARAAAAIARDRSFAIVYLPSTRTVTLDLRSMPESLVALRWYDPSNGRTFEVAGSPFSRSAERSLIPPGTNASGFSDWVLLLSSIAAFQN